MLKMGLQGAEETFGFDDESVEIERLRHKGIGAGLKSARFGVCLAAHGDDGSPVVRVGFDAPAYFNTVYPRDHDIQYHEIGFKTADLDHCGDAIRGGRNLVATLAIEEGLKKFGDLWLVLYDEDAEFFTNERFRRWNLMLPDECQKIFAPDSSMTAWRAIGWQETLLDPIDDGSRIHLKKPAYFVSCEDGLSFKLINHG